MRKSFVLELHGEWSESADECIGQQSLLEGALPANFLLQFPS